MHEFVPNNVTSSKESCPTEEEMAAYIDGKLGWADGERITGHLASCEDCYAIYMGTVRFQLDSDSETENVVRFPDRRQPWNWLQWVAAACLAYAVVAGGWHYFLGRPPDLSTSDITRPV